MDSSVSRERRNVVSARVPSHFNWPLPLCNGYSVPPRDASVKVTLNARPLLKSAAQKLCRCKCAEWTRKTRARSVTVFSIEMAYCCSWLTEQCLELFKRQRVHETGNLPGFVVLRKWICEKNTGNKPVRDPVCMSWRGQKLLTPASGVPRNFVGGGFNKFSWGQRTKRTGIWGAVAN